MAEENIGEGWSRQSLELDELTAQGDKVNALDKLTIQIQYHLHYNK